MKVSTLTSENSTNVMSIRIKHYTFSHLKGVSSGLESSSWHEYGNTFILYQIILNCTRFASETGHSVVSFERNCTCFHWKLDLHLIEIWFFRFTIPHLISVSDVCYLWKCSFESFSVCTLLSLFRIQFVFVFEMAVVESFLNNSKVVKP